MRYLRLMPAASQRRNGKRGSAATSANVPMARRRPPHTLGPHLHRGTTGSDMIDIATAERDAALALFDLAGAASAIAGAHRAGLLAALLEGSRTAAEHADRLGLNPRATAG